MAIESSVRDTIDTPKDLKSDPKIDHQKNLEKSAPEPNPKQKSETSISENSEPVIMRSKRHRTPPRSRSPMPDRPPTGKSAKSENNDQGQLGIESSDEDDDQPISTLIKRKNEQFGNDLEVKKVKIDAQVMDEAMLNLISLSEL